MNYFEVIISIFCCCFLYYFFKKYKFFDTHQKHPHQNFTYKNFVMPIGGYYLILSIFIFNFHNLNLEFLYIFIIFIIGALSDLKKFNSPKNRLIAQSILILFFVYQFNILLTSTRIEFLDILINNYFFNIFFVSFCILIVINGTNFIDGLNGSVLLYYIFIILIILNSGLETNFLGNNYFLKEILFVFVVLLLLNMFNQIYIGDSGSYLIGFIFAVFLIKIYEQNQYISPFFIILLLWYPCFENLFSILRKNSFKKSPIKPDTKHLHQLLFYFLNKKFNFKNKLTSNNLTSFLINLYNLVIFIISFNYITKTNIQVILILLNLFIYLIVYFKLFKFRYKDF